LTNNTIVKVLLCHAVKYFMNTHTLHMHLHIVVLCRFLAVNSVQLA